MSYQSPETKHFTMNIRIKMSIKRTFTNVWRELFPVAAEVYDELINAQNTYDNMYGYDQYKVKENIPKMYNQWIQRQIDALEKDYQYDNDKIKELEEKKLVTNKELIEFIPTNGNPITNVDKYKTKEDLMNQQIQLMYWESLAQKEWQKARNAQSYIDSYRKANDSANDKLWNRNLKTLKDLWVSMDDIRAEYFRRYPTPQMEAWDKAWEMLNDYVYRILDGTSKDVDTDKREAKKIFVENLTWMINDWQIEYNIDRIKRFVDAYDSIFQNNRNISGPRRGVKTPSSAGQRKFIR